MAAVADDILLRPGKGIFTSLELFFNNLGEFQGLKRVCAAEICHKRCTFCNTDDKFDQINL